MYRSETDTDRDRVNMILDKLLPKPAPSRSALVRRRSDGPLRSLEDSRTRQGVASESRRVSDIMDQITSLKMQQDDFVAKQMRMDLHRQRLDNEIVAQPVQKTRRWKEGRGIFKETKDIMVVLAADDKFNSSVTLSTENSSGVSSDGWESGRLISPEVERVDLEHKIHGEC
jgi:hypothetical protein